MACKNVLTVYAKFCAKIENENGLMQTVICEKVSVNVKAPNTCSNGKVQLSTNLKKLLVIFKETNLSRFNNVQKRVNLKMKCAMCQPQFAVFPWTGVYMQCSAEYLWWSAEKLEWHSLVYYQN